MTTYADFTYYQNVYLGVVIADTDFPRLALRASAVIDRITFNRATAETVVANINSIKMAMCAVAEELQIQDDTDTADGLASESQGQYSVSYLASSSKSKTNLERQRVAASVWLANTYLMFSGFNSGEYGGALDTE